MSSLTDRTGRAEKYENMKKMPQMRILFLLDQGCCGQLNPFIFTFFEYLLNIYLKNSYFKLIFQYSDIEIFQNLFNYYPSINFTSIVVSEKNPIMSVFITKLKSTILQVFNMNISYQIFPRPSHLNYSIHINIIAYTLAYVCFHFSLIFFREAELRLQNSNQN